MAPEPWQDPFEPTDAELEAARRLLSDEQHDARRILRALLAHPRTPNELVDRLDEPEAPLTEDAMQTALGRLDRDELIHHAPSSSEDGLDEPIQATTHGVRVALTLATLRPLADRMKLVDKLQGGRRLIEDDLARTWYVLPDEGRSWRVERGNASRASGRFDTKDEAIEQARAWASEKNGGHVVVHRRDGSFQRRIQPA